MLVAEIKIIILQDLTADIHNLLYIMLGLISLAIDITFILLYSWFSMSSNLPLNSPYSSPL